MAIEKMSLVNIAGLMDELDATLKRCCESGCFHIEPAGNSPDSAMKPLSEKNEYDRPLKELAQLSAQLGITLRKLILLTATCQLRRILTPCLKSIIPLSASLIQSGWSLLSVSQSLEGRSDK